MPDDMSARYLAQLAFQATTNTKRGEYLDWYICRLARFWEENHALAASKRSLRPAYALFDARRWNEICYLVRADAFKFIFSRPHTFDQFVCPPAELALVDRAIALEFELHVKEAVQRVCVAKFAELLAEIDGLGLERYSPVRKPSGT